MALDSLVEQLTASSACECDLSDHGILEDTLCDSAGSNGSDISAEDDCCNTLEINPFILGSKTLVTPELSDKC